MIPWTPLKSAPAQQPERGDGGMCAYDYIIRIIFDGNGSGLILAVLSLAKIMTGSFCQIIKLDYVRIRTQHDSPRSKKLSVDGDDLTIVKNRIYLTWHQKNMISV
jgi:hypothetical protein